MATLKVTNIKNESFAGDQLYLKTDGKIGIGTTSPANEFVISKSGSGANCKLEIAQSGGGGGTSEILFSDSVSGRGRIFFNHGSNPEVLSLEAAGTIGLSVTNAGKIGIGTVAPDVTLHVNSGSTNTVALFESTDTEATIQLKDTTGSSYIKARNDFRFENSTGELMRIESTGNLGIGTTSPGTLLHLSAATPILRFQDSDGTNQLTEISNAGGHTYIKSRNNTSGGNLYINTWDNGNSNYPTLFTILNGGNVGIGTTSPGYKLHVAEGTTDVVASFTSSDANAWIQFRDDDTTDTAVMIGANDDNLLLRAGSNTRMYIASNGNVGIGTTTPGDYYSPELVVAASNGGGITIKTADNHVAHLMFADGSSGSDRYAGYIGYNHNTEMLLLRGDGAGGKGLNIESDGDVALTHGNLVVANGKGINFSATADATGSGISMDSELLDDYERGTWGSINTGASSCTFSHNWYVKVGRVVTCNVRLSGITTTTGDALTLNLPFANGTVEASGSVACDTFNMPSDWVLMNSYAYDSKLYILASRDNAGWENLLGNMTATNSTIIMNITYLANS